MIIRHACPPHGKNEQDREDLEVVGGPDLHFGDDDAAGLLGLQRQFGACFRLSESPIQNHGEQIGHQTEAKSQVSDNF